MEHRFWNLAVKMLIKNKMSNNYNNNHNNNNNNNNDVFIETKLPSQIGRIIKKIKVKSSMARSLPVENLVPQNVGSIINYLQ